MKYIVVAPGFQDDSGGSIVLHYLCHLLNRAGHEAKIYPYGDVRMRNFRTSHDYVNMMKYLAYRFKRRRWRFKTNPHWITPIAQSPVPRDSVVIYPEIAAGNPLGAQHVVRWFLHKPGFLTGNTAYGEDELYFFYQEAFNDTRINQHVENLLRIAWHRDDIYRTTNFGERSGTCYMLRKGRGRPLVHDSRDSVLVDGMTHEELAEMFNEKQYFICYDPYTMYSRFAAMCGCISVVVPEAGVSKEAWRPERELRLGIAYGFDDIEWAVETQPALRSFIERDKEQQEEMVARFVSKTRGHFGIGCIEAEGSSPTDA